MAMVVAGVGVEAEAAGVAEDEVTQHLQHLRPALWQNEDDSIRGYMKPDARAASSIRTELRITLIRTQHDHIVSAAAAVVVVGNDPAVAVGRWRGRPARCAPDSATHALGSTACATL